MSPVFIQEIDSMEKLMYFVSNVFESVNTLLENRETIASIHHFNEETQNVLSRS